MKLYSDHYLTVHVIDPKARPASWTLEAVCGAHARARGITRLTGVTRNVTCPDCRLILHAEFLQRQNGQPS
ncbi:hypothetical protein [Changpingibacter yushuensis]|uniref:hypothetical protein n=1 Tax=Changpingibacter yushuensis TaxID=2758440 RepID=UPI00165DEA7F|nr:hypothetical protein [Changpingibacter yushuensis]